VHDPARAPVDCENDVEHVLWEMESLQEEAGVEIDVGMEVPGDEILMLSRLFLKGQSNLEEGIGESQFLVYLEA